MEGLGAVRKHGSGLGLSRLTSGLSVQCAPSRMSTRSESASLRGSQKRMDTVSIANESDQVTKEHLVDALAVRGDEGRGTLR